MNNLDTRVQFSKAAFRKALLKILEKKHIDRVTVKELCEEAKLNRGTFYLHYATPNDILMEIEQQFIDENLAHFSPYFDGSYETNALAGMFANIFRNQELCRVIMGPNGSPKFTDRLRIMMHDMVIDGWCREMPQYRREDLDYVFDFVFTGSMRLILSWIDDNQGMTTAELARRLDRLGHYCHLAIREFR